MKKLYAHNHPIHGLLLNDKPRTTSYGTIYCSMLELKECIKIQSITEDIEIQLVVTFDENKIKY